MEQKPKGYIKLYRSFFDSKMWQADQTFSEREAWIDLIQSARFEASPILSRIGSCEVQWGRGQYPASVRFLSKKWGRSFQWVRTFLSKLKRDGMITIDGSQGVNVITLTNYDKYNGEDDVCDTPNNTPSNTPLRRPVPSRRCKPRGMSSCWPAAPFQSRRYSAVLVPVSSLVFFFSPVQHRTVQAGVFLP